MLLTLNLLAEKISIHLKTTKTENFGDRIVNSFKSFKGILARCLTICQVLVKEKCVELQVC